MCVFLFCFLSSLLHSILTHWGRAKMAAIFQTTFSNAFSWMKMLEFRLKGHWRLFARGQLTIFQLWFREWLGAVQATSQNLNQWWSVYWRIYASLGLNELKKTCSHVITSQKAMLSGRYIHVFQWLNMFYVPAFYTPIVFVVLQVLF